VERLWGLQPEVALCEVLDRIIACPIPKA
jgi:hypothetical protein